MKSFSRKGQNSQIIILIITTSLLLIYLNTSTHIMKTINYLPQPPANWQPLRILTANVGNLDLNCRKRYNYKLCIKSVETKISQSIQILRPDIVFLQELMHPSQCEGWSETDAKKVCFAKNEEEVNQARRLLGPDYTIICATRMRKEIGHPVGMECIGVHTNAGEIEKCKTGELCYSIENSDIPGNNCNPEFIIMSAIAKIKNLTIRLVNAHPNSRDKYCRDYSLAQLFTRQENISTLESNQKTIIAGDFNFDPFKSTKSSPEIWENNVGLFGSGKPFYYHSGLAENTPPYPTAYFLLQKRTIDHVVSNFALGVCKTLGEAPDTTRIDGGKGMDHRAILCDMWIPPQ